MCIQTQLVSFELCLTVFSMPISQNSRVNWFCWATIVEEERGQQSRLEKYFGHANKDERGLTDKMGTMWQWCLVRLQGKGSHPRFSPCDFAPHPVSRRCVCRCAILLLDKQVLLILRWFGSCHREVSGFNPTSTNVIQQGPRAMHWPVTCSQTGLAVSATRIQTSTCNEKVSWFDKTVLQQQMHRLFVDTCKTSVLPKNVSAADLYVHRICIVLVWTGSAMCWLSLKEGMSKTQSHSSNVGLCCRP